MRGGFGYGGALVIFLIGLVLGGLIGQSYRPVRIDSPNERELECKALLQEQIAMNEAWAKLNEHQSKLQAACTYALGACHEYNWEKVEGVAVGDGQ